jgi:hypothetical protein
MFIKIVNLFAYMFNQCCGSGMFFTIPDSTFFHPGSEFSQSRIRIKEFKYSNSKKWFLSSRKYDPGCSSRIRILTFSHPGSRIRIRNIVFNWRYIYLTRPILFNVSNPEIPSLQIDNYKKF